MIQLQFAKSHIVRLALIAAKVEEATRANVPLGPIAREQLAQNKRNSTHCQA